MHTVAGQCVYFTRDFELIVAPSFAEGTQLHGHKCVEPFPDIVAVSRLHYHPHFLRCDLTLVRTPTFFRVRSVCCFVFSIALVQ